MATRFLGWRMVTVAFFVDFVAVGFFFYSYGVFFKAIAAEFGDSRLGVALGLTATNAVGAIVAPMVGRALDKYPLRRIIGIGATSMALGFVLLSTVQNPWQFYLVIGLFIGFGASSMGQLATSKLVTNWFDRRRSTALGIAATGVSLSGVFMPAISAELIEAFGWRNGFLVYGLFTGLVVVPLVLRLVISRPEDVGLLPDGALKKVTASSVTPTAPPPRLRMSAVVRDRNFWVIASGFALVFCCMSATLTHMVPRVTDLGHPLALASYVMSLCAGLGVAGKLCFGYLGDRLGARTNMWAVIAIQFTGQAIMYLNHDLLWFSLGAALFGFGVGGVVPLQATTVAKTFGRERFGAVLGLIRPAQFPIQILGVPFAGWVFDSTGSYDLSFQVFLAVYVVAAVAFVFYRKPTTSVA
ncbi:MAG: MFS transporter [Pseudomonadota bacterium]